MSERTPAARTAGTDAHGGEAAARQAIERVWREEAARLIAGVARLTRDIGAAEEHAQDALIAAIEHWPSEGLPDNPGAWLMATAKRRALDRLRQQAMQARKHVQLGHEADALGEHLVPDIAEAVSIGQHEDIDDDLLRLIFTACHPVLSRDAQLALTLRVVGGLSVAEIARAFLVPEPTISQRIVRAKRTLAAARVPFETPSAAERPARLAAVLDVIYLIFNEGYAATSGDAWTRPALCDEALRLGRLLASLDPRDAEVHGLLALMELQASRLAARVDADGEPVLLLEQDRARWDGDAIARGLAALARCEAICGTGTPGDDGRPASALGPRALQAEIAACHARARTAAQTDWNRIVALYDALAAVTPSPIVELNRAVAIGMAFGPAAALEIVDALDAEGELARYHLLPSVRGDLLAKLGRRDDARAAFELAASMTQNARERALLMARALASVVPGTDADARPKPGAGARPAAD